MSDNSDSENNTRNNVHANCPNNNMGQSGLYSSNLERDKYIQSLNAWINEAWQWQNYALRAPYYYLLNQANQPDNNQANAIGAAYVRRTTNVNVNGNIPHNNVVPQNRNTSVINPTEGLVFSIPPVWKRILAECVDFIILFVAKLILTLIIFEVLDKSDFTMFKENVTSNILEFTWNPELTNGLIILEALHRIMVCVYEVYWLYGTNEIRFGCATPGKALIGLTVVVATKIKDIEPNNPNNNKVLLYPGKDLGLFIAAGRAFIKNVVIALMFPFCFAMFLFQFNRTGYDIICNTIVVEYDPDPPRRNWT